MKRVFISGIAVGLGIAALVSVALLKQTEDVIAQELTSSSVEEPDAVAASNPFDTLQPIASDSVDGEIPDYATGGEIAAPASVTDGAFNEPVEFVRAYGSEPPQVSPDESAPLAFNDPPPVTEVLAFGQDAGGESTGLFSDNPVAVPDNSFQSPPTQDPFQSTQRAGNVQPIDEEAQLRQQFLELARKQSELMTTDELKSAVGVAATSVSELAAKRSLERARVLLEEILEQHPESAAAKEARDMLKPSSTLQLDDPFGAGEVESFDDSVGEPETEAVPNADASFESSEETE